MRRLQIGMWHQFIRDRWNDISNDFISGMEISKYPNKEAVEELSRFCMNENLKFGVHGPILNT
ncbi:hypothetical protein [Paenibacillus faecalis]|uniref:hypothetical protein n=1 Tax=Paenibacillus faecalis TaxID=2079532 RepID=UPI000D0EE692|nr:hypothetical protein [Paenibacillus faecalis]